MSLAFPARYEPCQKLGMGGGGEVWEVRDRYTEQRYALKFLAEDATEHEREALVREATALSGLEGLGVPRVLRFGRLPQNGRPYMVRELIEGQSLEALIAGTASTRACLQALALAAEQLTLLHRAGFFHGDIKPANIIVNDVGGVTLVDLGLAAPWREDGTVAPGLTPRYAAPELLGGKPLTVRAEVYALGVTTREIVERGERSLNLSLIRDLLLVAQTATAVEPDQRYPSADEFANALRRAAGFERPSEAAPSTLIWPIVGIDSTASRLLQRVLALAPGECLDLGGPLVLGAVFCFGA
jgi:serine/threonine-protein kinase PknK